MAAPTITSIAPAVGLTSGGTLVEITGTNFRVPAYPPAEGVTETPTTMRVTFGGEVGTIFGVLDETTLLVLTPSNDESGVPATALNTAIPASDVTIENLDDNGDPIAGESATATEVYSFRKPILDKPTTMERVIEELRRQFQRALPRGVDLVYQPHTDYDDTTGDALDIVRFARLPGVGLTGERTPKSELKGDETDHVVKHAGDLRSSVHRSPVRRDLILTVVIASNITDELRRLAVVVEGFLRSYTKVRIPKDPSDDSRGYNEYGVIFGMGEITFTDRQDGNVRAASGELRVFHIEEDSAWGAPEAGLADAPSWTPHEGTRGMVWPIEDPRLTAEGS